MEKISRTEFVEMSLVPKSLLDQLDRIEEQIELHKEAHKNRRQEFASKGCYAHIPMNIDHVNAVAEKSRLERAIVRFVREQGRRQRAA